MSDSRQQAVHLKRQVAKLTAEVERLRNDRNLEKRWRKDADDRVATLTEALEQAGRALREEAGGWTRASAKTANIIEAALASVRGETR